MKAYRIPIEASVGCIYIKAETPEEAWAKLGSYSWLDKDTPDTKSDVFDDPQPFDINRDDLEEMEALDADLIFGEEE